MNAAKNQPSILTLRLGQSDQAGQDPGPDQEYFSPPKLKPGCPFKFARASGSANRDSCQVHPTTDRTIEFGELKSRTVALSVCEILRFLEAVEAMPQVESESLRARRAEDPLA